MTTRQVTPLASYRGATPALETRGWAMALAFQEVLTAIVRVRYNRQTVPDANSFRAQMKHALQLAQQEAVARGYSNDDIRQALFAVVAFLDESVLGSGNRIFADWPRLPLQTELFGHQMAGEMFFQDLQKNLGRPDSDELCDLLEVYALCLQLGFKGRYASGGGDLRSLLATVYDKMRRIRPPSTTLSPKGTLPAEAVRMVQSDPWIRKLAIFAVASVVIAIALFTLFKLLLASGVSEAASFM